MNWNLDNIYKSFSSQEFVEDIKTVKNKIREFSKFNEDTLKNKNGESLVKTLEDVFLEYENITSIYTKLSQFVFLKLSCNSNDKDALNNDNLLKDIYVDLFLINSMIIKMLSNNDEVINVLNDSEILKEYSFIIREMIDESKHIFPDDMEESMATLLNYGAYSYSIMQDTLVSKYKVTINLDGEDKEIPLTECRSLLEDFNRDKRKRALDAEKRLYTFMEDPISFSLNNIKKSVIYDNKKRGYESPISKTLKDNRISKETLDSLISVIEDSLPLFRDFLKLKAKLIGDKENKVYFSDLFAQSLKYSKEIDFDYAKDFLIKNFYNFSDKVGNFVKGAFDNRWIDSEIYEGKVGGAFCDNINSIKESRILLNFNNSYDGVFTLAHELGHAYHGEILKNERILNTNYPMTIAETASIFFETLICDKAFNGANGNDKIIILEYELNSATQTIVDIYSRFLFEKGVFERCKNEFLTPDDLNSIMLDSQKKAYGDAMHDDYFPQAWIYKSHYYSFDYNFYNYPYAFGLLLSLGLYNNYLQNENDFHNRYDLLLRESGRNTLEDLVKIFKIDITKKEFFESSIQILKSKYDKFKSLVN